MLKALRNLKMHGITVYLVDGQFRFVLVKDNNSNLMAALSTADEVVAYSKSLQSTRMAA